MAATTLLVKNTSKLERLVDQLRQDFPAIKFKLGEREYWSARQNSIFYSPARPKKAQIGILHELGHALLGHRTYASDFELLRMEAAAWAKAVELGRHYGLKISDEHIQNCLDTYRHWLYKRSLCPACASQGVQTSNTKYRCPNCQKDWSVTSSRFRRPYRLSKKFVPKNPA